MAGGGAIFVASGSVTLTADTLAFNAAIGGNGGNGGSGGAGGHGREWRPRRAGRGQQHGNERVHLQQWRGRRIGDRACVERSARRGQTGCRREWEATAARAGTAAREDRAGTDWAEAMAERHPVAESIWPPGSLTTLNTTIAKNSAQGGAAGIAGVAGQGEPEATPGPGGRAGAGGVGRRPWRNAAELPERVASRDPRHSRAARRRPGLPGNSGTSGAGALSVAGGTATLDNTTIALNVGLGVACALGGTVMAISTLFAGNGSLDYRGTSPRVIRCFKRRLRARSPEPETWSESNPLLAAQGLANNGGPTATIALQSGSPAASAAAAPIPRTC